jgi:hypothetical protein
VVAVPWIATASNGTITTALAEAVDIMPTAIELAGVVLHRERKTETETETEPERDRQRTLVCVGCFSSHGAEKAGGDIRIRLETALLSWRRCWV